MKTLELTFQSNNDKSGLHTFTQVKRNAHAALYQRVNADGHTMAFEVFRIKVVKEGASLPNGTKVPEAYEAYPGASAFGKTAWCCVDLKRANDRFDRITTEAIAKNEPEADKDETFLKALVTRLNEPKGKGRKRNVRPDMVYPSTEQFFMKDLVALNPIWNQPLCYQQVQIDIKAGKVVEAGRVKSASGRGKPSVAYRLTGS